MRNPMSQEERESMLEDGAALLASGRPFEAHEAFEELWNSTDRQAERDLWQGMAQVAAALVKYDRGEPGSAITLLARAKKRLTGSGLLRDDLQAVNAFLDGLAEPVTCERELGDTSVTPDLMERLRRIVGRDAPG